jgi:hypothetical protein
MTPRTGVQLPLAPRGGRCKDLDRELLVLCARHAERIDALLGCTTDPSPGGKKADGPSEPHAQRDLFGQPLPTDLFGNPIEPSARRRR